MKPLSAASTIIRVQFSDGTIGGGYRPAIEELAEKHGLTFTVLRERMVFGGQEVAIEQAGAIVNHVGLEQEIDDWVEQISKRFYEFFAQDEHDHEDAREHKDCFLSWIEERLEAQLEDDAWHMDEQDGGV